MDQPMYALVNVTSKNLFGGKSQPPIRVLVTFPTQALYTTMKICDDHHYLNDCVKPFVGKSQCMHNIEVVYTSTEKKWCQQHNKELHQESDMSFIKCPTWEATYNPPKFHALLTAHVQIEDCDEDECQNSPYIYNDCAYHPYFLVTFPTKLVYELCEGMSFDTMYEHLNTVLPNEPDQFVDDVIEPYQIGTDSTELELKGITLAKKEFVPFMKFEVKQTWTKKNGRYSWDLVICGTNKHKHAEVKATSITSK